MSSKARLFHRRMSEVETRGPSGFFSMPHGLCGGIVWDEGWCGFSTPVGWRGLRCETEARVGSFTVRIDCGGREKVFVRLGRRRLRSLHDYARLVQGGVITEQDTLMLMGFLEQRRRLAGGGTFVNHNLEVDVLHFKLEPDRGRSAVHG